MLVLLLICILDYNDICLTCINYVWFSIPYTFFDLKSLKNMSLTFAPKASLFYQYLLRMIRILNHLIYRSSLTSSLILWSIIFVLIYIHVNMISDCCSLTAWNYTTKAYNTDEAEVKKFELYDCSLTFTPFRSQSTTFSI